MLSSELIRTTTNNNNNITIITLSPPTTTTTTLSQHFNNFTPLSPTQQDDNTNNNNNTTNTNINTTTNTTTTTTTTHSTIMTENKFPLVLGPAIISQQAVTNGCKSCYTRPPHLKAKCCGPGKAKLFKKKSKILNNVMMMSTTTAVLQKNHHDVIGCDDSTHDDASSMVLVENSSCTSFIHLEEANYPQQQQHYVTQVRTENKHVLNENKTLSDITYPRGADNDETTIIINKPSSLVDVTTHQEGIEKPSRMRSILSGLLQRGIKSRFMLRSFGLSSSDDSSVTNLSASSPPSSNQQ